MATSEAPPEVCGQWSAEVFEGLSRHRPLNLYCVLTPLVWGTGMLLRHFDDEQRRQLLILAFEMMVADGVVRWSRKPRK